MERVTGIGGIFFRSKAPDAIRRWYEANLGLPAGTGDDPTVVLRWREYDDPERPGSTVGRRSMPRPTTSGGARTPG